MSYSFTLLSYPNNNINQTHIFLVPTSASLLNGNAVYGNEYIEYQAANALWLDLQPNGAGRATATVEWKTNLPNANPGTGVTNITYTTNGVVITTNIYANPAHIPLIFTNSTAIGTWTLTFTGPNDGSVTAPGAARCRSPLATPMSRPISPILWSLILDCNPIRRRVKDCTRTGLQSGYRCCRDSRE